ncbi:MAG: response regulator [Candidatus Hydrogenedentota bacterium]
MKIEPSLRKLVKEDLKKIFILEDDENVCELLKNFLEDGYNLVFEKNGSKALSEIQIERPDLILLDIRIPEQSGIEVLKLLKLYSSTKNIPVVMLTALADKPTVIECLKLGANDYIVKPFDIKILKDKISSLITTEQRR